MNALRICALSVLACILLTGTAFAQVHPAWFERGVSAYEEARYEDAETAFNWIIERESENAAAHYWMARVLVAKEDLKAADRSIVRALRIEPENTAFMELQLEIGFPREPLEIIRNTRRDELAAKILEIDSLSVPANLHVGQRWMKEWLRWRKRISVQGLTPLSAGALANTQLNSETWQSIDQIKATSGETRAVTPADVFDVGRQEALGGDVLDMSGYADKSYPAAVAYLNRVLLRDPANQKAYLNLARLYITSPDMPVLIQLAMSMQAYAPQDFYGWLLAGYAQHNLMHEPEAEQQFDKALEMMPDDLRSVYLDTDRIMNSAGLKQKENQPDFSTESFWDFRDPRLLTEENERISEHYARIVYSDLLFSEPKLDLVGRDSERGEVYIRYGRPVNEYFLSGKLADCGNTTYEHFHVFEYPMFRFVFGNLSPHLNQYVFYSPCSQVYLSRQSIGARIDYQIIAKENIRELPEAFDYDASGIRVEFPYLTSNFKGSNGTVDVLVPYGIPVQINALQMTQTLDIEAGAFLLSEEEGVLSEHRRHVQDIRVKDITLFEEGALWLDTHQLKVRPGAYNLSVEFETGTGSGAGFHRSTLEIPDFESGRLQLSDLLLAYAVEEADSDQPEIPAGMFHRDGLLIKPAPWGVFSNRQPMYLFFEMYNLRRNAEDRTQYEVEALLLEYSDDKGLDRLLKRAFRGRGREGVSARFENTSNNRDEGQYLILDIQDQPAGQYVVVMRVRDLVSDETVEARRIVLLE